MKKILAIAAALALVLGGSSHIFSIPVLKPDQEDESFSCFEYE